MIDYQLYNRGVTCDRSWVHLPSGSYIPKTLIKMVPTASLLGMQALGSEVGRAS